MFYLNMRPLVAPNEVADGSATAKRDLVLGGPFDGKGGYKVWDTLTRVAGSLEWGGLYYVVKLMLPRVSGQLFSWADVATDAGTGAYALHLKLEAMPLGPV